MAVILLADATVHACQADYPIWIPRSQDADPLYRFIRNGQAGYIDGTGRIVIPPGLDLPFNYGSEFHDGLLEIAAGSGQYINRRGKLAGFKGLYRGSDFSEGLAAAMKSGGHPWGYINSSGEFAISPRFETSPHGDVYPFSDGIAMIDVNGQFGYISHSGDFTIKPQFPDAISFRNGMARVVVEGPCVYFPEGGCGGMNPRYVGGKQGSSAPCKFTFIDNTGRIITHERYNEARSFSEELAPVQIGKLWGFIDKRGSLRIAPKFDGAEPFSSGLSRIRTNGLYGYADKSGAIKIAPQFKYAEDFNEGLAVVGNDVGTFWYVDRNGNRAIAENFLIASPFGRRSVYRCQRPPGFYPLIDDPRRLRPF